MFLLFKGCGGRSVDADRVKKVTDSLVADKAAVVRELDSVKLVNKWVRDSAALALQEHTDNRTLLSDEIRKNEGRITQLIAQVRHARVDTSKPIYSYNCDELADSTERLMVQNKELAEVNATIEDNYTQQLQQADTALAHAFAAFERVSRNFDTCIAINNALRKDLTRAGVQVYIGATGVYNPTTYGVGGTLMLKTKRDKLYGISGVLTNSGMLYQAQALIKISFRR